MLIFVYLIAHYENKDKFINASTKLIYDKKKWVNLYNNTSQVFISLLYTHCFLSLGVSFNDSLLV